MIDFGTKFEGYKTAGHTRPNMRIDDIANNSSAFNGGTVTMTFESLAIFGCTIASYKWDVEGATVISGSDTRYLTVEAPYLGVVTLTSTAKDTCRTESTYTKTIIAGSDIVLPGIFLVCGETVSCEDLIICS